MDWSERIQRLWLDYLFWIRYYIFSLMLQRPDQRYVASRAMRNTTEFSEAFASFYGEEVAKQFGDLLTQHINLLSQFTTTMRSGQECEPLREVLYAGAGEIAAFLASLNPYWDTAAWQELLQRQFYLEETLIWRLYRQDYQSAVLQYDDEYANVQQIANYMFEGLSKQFQLPLPTEQSPST